jgi:transposase-like protein
LEVKPQLSVFGRWLLVQRVMSGRPVAHVAAELGISRATGYKWWRRWREEGPAGLYSRSSRPHTSPTRTAAEIEQRVLALRRDRRLGPARIAGIVGLPPSTVHRILTRHRHPGGSRFRGRQRPGVANRSRAAQQPVTSTPPTSDQLSLAGNVA